MSWRLPIISLICVFCSLISSDAFAGRDNKFSGAILLGDSYAPNNFRVSIYSFDLGVSDMSGLYVGSRAWLDNYYAGFGFSERLSMYGMVGYEWRFASWLGLSGEFTGTMSVQGQASGRVYIGLVAGW
jgi:hypothetical protein